MNLLATAVCLLAGLSPAPAGAAASYGTTAADLWKMPVAPRAAALAGAFSTVNDDVTAPWTNPAGLADLPRTNLSLSDFLSLADVSVQQFSLAFPSSAAGVWGFQTTYRSTSINNGTQLGSPVEGATFAADLEARLAYAISFSERTAPTNPSEPALPASLALPGGRHLRGLSMGVAIQWLYSRITAETAADRYKWEAAAADVGLQWQSPNPRLRAAFAIQNIGPASIRLKNSVAPGGSDSSLPMLVRLGASYRIYNGPVAVNTLMLEGWQTSDGLPRVSAALEYVYMKFLFARVGYALDSFWGGQASALSAGIGLRGTFGDKEARLDYAYRPMNVGFTTSTHVFAVSYRY